MQWLRCSADNDDDFWVFVEIPTQEFAQLLSRGFRDRDLLEICHTERKVGRDPVTRLKHKDKGWNATVIKVSPYKHRANVHLRVRRGMVLQNATPTRQLLTGDHIQSHDRNAAVLLNLSLVKDPTLAVGISIL